MRDKERESKRERERERERAEIYREREINLHVSFHSCFFFQFYSFDITFGKEVLVANAELTMAYGRKYGLIGRNGSGSKKNKHE